MEDPAPLTITLEPLDDHLIVEPVIPQSAEAGCRSGIVTAVGAEAQGIDPGDKVLFPKDAGYDVRLGGVACKVLSRRELIARVHD